MRELLEELAAKIQTAIELYEEEVQELLEAQTTNVAEDELEEVDYDVLKLSELRAIAKEFGINTKGLTKAQIIEALEEEEAEGLDEDEEDEEEELDDEYEDDGEDEDDLPDYEDMTRAELKAEARERGIRIKRADTKEDIIEKLEADDEE